MQYDSTIAAQFEHEYHSMSLQERNVVSLYYYDDLSIDDIATIMHLSLREAEALFNAAVRRLSSIIGVEAKFN